MILPSFVFQTPPPPPNHFLNRPTWSSFMLRLSLLSLKPRLSSLTIGDSDRKSSAPQQKELTADVAVESTGNWDWSAIDLLSIYYPWITTNILLLSFRSSWSCPAMCGGPKGPSGLRLHSVWRKNQTSAECPTRSDSVCMLSSFSTDK